MANRRMFARTIVNSARFLMMPSTARLLYYDLGMAADDDGVVEAFAVMRMTNASEDDLRVLASKGFVRVLNEDLVSWITDWNSNNYIQKDRYTPSIYAKLLNVDTECIHNGDRMYTQVRLSKDSIEIDKDNITPSHICKMLHIDTGWRYDRSIRRAVEQRMSDWIGVNTLVHGNVLECVHTALENGVDPERIFKVALDARDFYGFSSRLMAEMSA